MQHERPSRLNLFQYSLIALPLSFAGLPLYIHMPDFYSRELGLSVGILGIILLTIRLFDAFQDPLIGYLSDKYARNRFHIFMVGCFVLSCGVVGLFVGPQMFVATPIWFTVFMILATTGFSIVVINLNTVGGLWQNDEHGRMRISGWREAFALCGLLFASILPTVLQYNFSSDVAFKILACVFVFVIVIGFIFFSKFYRSISRDHVLHTSQSRKGFSFLSLLFGADKYFFAACFLTHVAASIPAVTVLFFINDYLNAENYTGLFLFLYFISGAVFMPVWMKLSERYGQEKAWMASMLLAVISFMWAFGLNEGDVISFAIICLMSGMALGADLAIPPAIMANRVAQQKTEAEATQYYAVLAFIPKMALAISSGLILIILDRNGFVPGDTMTENARATLIALYALVPCLVKLAALFLVWSINKNKGDHNDLTERSAYHGNTHVS